MIRVPVRRWTLRARAASLLSIALVAASVALSGQEQFAIYVFAVDRNGAPVLELETSNISIKEDVGPSNVVSVRRFGWPPSRRPGVAHRHGTQPELAQQVALRYIKQMAQHRIVLERAAGARGPMKHSALTLMNHPGAKVVFSTDGNMP